LRRLVLGLLALALAGWLLLLFRQAGEIPAADVLTNDARRQELTPQLLRGASVTQAGRPALLVVQASGLVEDGLLIDAASDRAWCHEPEDAALEKLFAADAVASAPLEPEQFLERLRSVPSLRRSMDASAQQLQRWAQALAARGDERSLAAAEFLQERREALAVRASRSQDPFVLALALRRCGSGGPGSCQALSPLRWAALEPGNLQPWLLQTQGPDAKAQPQALAEALHQIAQSSQARSYQRDFMALLLSLPRSERPGFSMAVQTGLLVQLQASWLAVSIQPLLAWCERAPLDANLAQTCASAAERLWLGADNLLDASLAIALAKRLGPDRSPWPERRRQLEALRAAQIQGSSASTTGSNVCTGMGEQQVALVSMLRQGELSALRAVMRRP